MGSILWTQDFLAEQGYDYKQIHQKNKSAVLIELSSRTSTGWCSSHIKIRIGCWLYEKATTWIEIQRIQTADRELVNKHNRTHSCGYSACGVAVGYDIYIIMYLFHLFQETQQGYQKIKKKGPVATMKSTSRQECVGESLNRIFQQTDKNKKCNDL